MAIVEVTYDSKKYSKDVEKLSLSNYTEGSRYSQKYNLNTNHGTYLRMMQIEDLVAEERDTDKYYIVPVQYEYDPFRVAEYYYGNRDLYWIILGANRLHDIFEFKAGLTIRLPDLATIYGVNGLLVRSDE